MVYLQLPANLNFRYLALRAIAAICRPLGQPVEFVDAVVSAVGEAFNNAVLHAHSPAGDPPADPVEIEVDLAPCGVKIRVFDYGQGFALADVPSLDLESLLIDDFPEGGMGLYIIRALMSDVTYTPGRPNVLAMRKELAIPPATPPGP